MLAITKPLFILLLSIFSAPAQAEVTQIATQSSPQHNALSQNQMEIVRRAPRSFGLMLGDIIEQTIRVNLSAEQSLNIHALPSVGSINPWLELQAFEYQLLTKAGESPARYEFHFTYQLFKQVTTPETLIIPASNLLLTSGALLPLPTWPIRYTPLANNTPIIPLAAATPSTYQTDTFLQQCILAAVGLFLCFCIGLWLRGYLPFGRHCFGPFTQAERQLRQLAKQPNTTAPQLLQYWQNTLASSAGYYVFPDQVAQYFQAHPDYQALQAATQQLLDQAHQARFNQHSQAAAFPSTDAILHLAQQFSRQEQLQWKAS